MNTVTPKQISYIKTLISSREISEIVEVTITESRNLHTLGEFTSAVASKLIDILKAQPFLPTDVTTAPAKRSVPVEGMHAYDGQIYKVQCAVHGSGNLYAKVLTPGNSFGEKSTFAYAPGVIRNLSADTLLTLDQAKAYGALYGSCAMCGRTLTDENSISAGIGPVCASKF